MTFIESAFTSSSNGHSLTLNEGTSIDSFKQLFIERTASESSLPLLSYYTTNGTIKTSRDITGNYICEGSNEHGKRSHSIEVNVNGMCLIEYN